MSRLYGRVQVILQQQCRVAAAEAGDEFHERIAVCRLVLQDYVDLVDCARGVCVIFFLAIVIF